MENVFTAFVVILLILFTVLTLSEVFVSVQSALATSWQEMEARRAEQTSTYLDATEAVVNDDGTLITLTYRNEGNSRLMDFKPWDVIIQYYDESDEYHVGWLPFKPGGTPSENEWAVEGIYLDATSGVEERFEPGILNPGEEIVLQVQVSPEIGPDTTALTALITSNGSSTPVQFTRVVEESIEE